MLELVDRLLGLSGRLFKLLAVEDENMWASMELVMGTKATHLKLSGPPHITIGRQACDIAGRPSGATLGLCLRGGVKGGREEARRDTGPPVTRDRSRTAMAATARIARIGRTATRWMRLRRLANVSSSRH
jgi:hypothetical protein